jgi:hypothetical protein
LEWSGRSGCANPREIVYRIELPAGTCSMLGGAHF